MALRQQNTDKAFPLGLAFEFLEAHGYQAEVEAIRSGGEATPSGAPRMRRVEVLVLLDEAGLTHEFNRQYWPRGLTEAGQKHLALLRGAHEKSAAAVGSGNNTQNPGNLAASLREAAFNAFGRAALEASKVVLVHPTPEGAQLLARLAEIAQQAGSRDPADVDHAYARVRELLKSALDLAELFYLDSTNPMFAWSGLLLAKLLEPNQPPPGWICAYFCQGAFKLLALQGAPPGRSAPLVSEMLGFSKGIGRRSTIRDFMQIEGLPMALCIHQSVRQGQSIHQVTGQLTQSEAEQKKAARAYERHRPLILRHEERLTQLLCPAP